MARNLVRISTLLLCYGIALNKIILIEAILLLIDLTLVQTKLLSSLCYDLLSLYYLSF